MRAIIYARFSSDKQSETSIDDQVRVCQRRADQDGFIVTSTHFDKSVSGATPIHLRVGGKALTADCLAGRCDVLLLEGLDRLSRDSHEQEGFIRRIEHRGVRIIGVCDGYDSQGASKKVVRAVRGLVNEIYLDDLRVKTHRGMTGQVVRGFHAGDQTNVLHCSALEGIKHDNQTHHYNTYRSRRQKTGWRDIR